MRLLGVYVFLCVALHRAEWEEKTNPQFISIGKE